jgi:cell division control protein 45
VLAALDVDSLCACKILQALFKADNVEHTLIPVAGKSDLQKAYADHSEQVYVVTVSRVYFIAG